MTESEQRAVRRSQAAVHLKLFKIDAITSSVQCRWDLYAGASLVAPVLQVNGERPRLRSHFVALALSNCRRLRRVLVGITQETRTSKRTEHICM